MEKPSSQIAESYAAEMIHFKSVPVLNVLVKQNREDADMQDDVLHEKLNTSLQDLRYMYIVHYGHKKINMYMYNKFLWMILICGLKWPMVMIGL